MGRSPNVILKGAPDPQFSSPEKTWQRYLAALRKGDREAAVSCLTSTAREKYSRLIQQAPNEQLRKMAESIKGFRVSSRFGDVIEAVAIRHDGHAGMIYFQNVDDEWKIGEM